MKARRMEPVEVPGDLAKLCPTCRKEAGWEDALAWEAPRRCPHCGQRLWWEYARGMEKILRKERMKKHMGVIYEMFARDEDAAPDDYEPEEGDRVTARTLIGGAMSVIGGGILWWAIVIPHLCAVGAAELATFALIGIAATIGGTMIYGKGDR